MFKPKDDTVKEISLDDAIELIVQEQKAKKEIEARIKNLKEVVKGYLSRMDVEKYVTSTGHSATFAHSSRMNINKEEVRRLLGRDFDLVCSFTDVTSFTVK